DTWLEVEGKMITETLKGKRQLVIEASPRPKTITKPANPYYY
ncbi:MAG: TIGR03943 family protein, partial [Nostoc sp. C3-bin3]|nr:TIGR03943 family protein [Nostoc sp. C3-bin3]